MYLQESKYQVKIYTDHKNLTWFLSTKKLNAWQTRWWEKLSSYDLKIIHTSEKENAQADALSRRSDHESKQLTYDMILKSKKDETITINKTMTFMIIVNNERVIKRVKQLQVKDHVAKKQLDNQSSEWNVRDELVYFKERLYVSADKQLRKQIMEQYHDASIAEHQEVQKH